MMSFNKSDMAHSDYIWTTRYSNNYPKVTREPDSTLLTAAVAVPSKKSMYET